MRIAQVQVVVTAMEEDADVERKGVRQGTEAEEELAVIYEPQGIKANPKGELKSVAPPIPLPKIGLLEIKGLHKNNLQWDKSLVKPVFVKDGKN